jgi:hypothetical protein
MGARDESGVKWMGKWMDRWMVERRTRTETD